MVTLGFKERIMKNAKWRGRLAWLCVCCGTLLGAGGCRGLTDQQLSSILSSVVSTALNTAVQTVITGTTGDGGTATNGGATP